MTRRRALVACAVAAASALIFSTAPPGHAATRLGDGSSGVLLYPLGDSITLGVSNGMPGERDPGGYRAPLDLLLQSSGIDHTFIGTRMLNPAPTLSARGQTAHDGHSSFRIDQVSTDLDGSTSVGGDNGGYWLTGTPDREPLQPDIVLLHLGTNDIRQWYDPGVVYPTPTKHVNYDNPSQRAHFVTDLTARLRALVDKIQLLRPNARVIVSAVVPLEIPEFEAVTQDYAGAVKRLVAGEQSQGHRVYLANVYQHFFKAVNGQPVFAPGLVSPGGIHPTPAGYQVMANVFLAAIKTALAG